MGLTSDIRTGLVDALDGSVTGVTVYGFMPASIPANMTALIVLPGEQLAVFGQSASSRPSRSVIAWAWRVLAAVPKSATGAQTILYRLIDSVPDALEVDRTLGGTARSVTCTGVGEVGEDEIAGTACLVATFDVDIITQQQAMSTSEEDEEDSG